MSVIAAIIVLTNAAFTVAYDSVYRCPSWVAYDLEPGEVVRAPRAAIPFSADPRIPESDVDEDYRGSGYDRGHMAPAADFNFSAEALAETYRMTNIAPQRPDLNRCRWLSIEKDIRDLARSGTVHVVTAPVCFGRTNRIGRVAVPAAFVKVAYGYFGFRIWIEGNE